MGYYSLRLCAGGGAFEAVPSPRLSLDLQDVRRTLEAHQVGVVDARVMLIVRLEKELTLSRDGRVLIKTKDAAQAASIFERLRGWLGLPSTEASR